MPREKPPSRSAPTARAAVDAAAEAVAGAQSWPAPAVAAAVAVAAAEPRRRIQGVASGACRTGWRRHSPSGPREGAARPPARRDWHSPSLAAAAPSSPAVDEPSSAAAVAVAEPIGWKGGDGGVVAEVVVAWEAVVVAAAVARLSKRCRILRMDWTGLVAEGKP